MKQRYAVRRIDTKTLKDVDEYNEAIKTADIHYCYGMKDVEKYCGGKLHRYPAGYGGEANGIDYIVTRE